MEKPNTLLTAYRSARFWLRKRQCDLLGGHKVPDDEDVRLYGSGGDGFPVVQCRRCLSLFVLRDDLG